MKTYKSINLWVRFFKIVLPFVLIIGLDSCKLNHLRDLEPSGPVTRSIDDLFWLTIALMSIILIPVFSMTAGFIWKYRASNSKASHVPDWNSPIWLEWLVWLFPALIVLILTIMTWIYTHRLDPYKPQEANTPPLVIQVIALDWKWLFIYPEQNIAVVNELTLPVNRPIAFQITSNTVMNSFFIPRLGGQIYAMAGMETQLHVIADKPGRYFGENIQYSGQGFPYQNFETSVTTPQDFDAWVKKAGQSAQILDLSAFIELSKPSVSHPVVYYAFVSPDLFNHVINQYIGGQKSLATVHVTHDNPVVTPNVR
ncbi:MAG: ubiquinol oxidase subunit II [Methylococcales bacterium]|nr:ubiquinol oxidase subunit II [Methylococcales bacterium]MDD5632283.1 ubiquinol oxidase subunit II [Methylococcales bacterium]